MSCSLGNWGLTTPIPLIYNIFLFRLGLSNISSFYEPMKGLMTLLSRRLLECFGLSGKLEIVRFFATLTLLLKLWSIILRKVKAIIQSSCRPSLTLWCHNWPRVHYSSIWRFWEWHSGGIIRVDGAWNKRTKIASATWVASILSSNTTINQVQVFRAMSALQDEAKACL